MTRPQNAANRSTKRSNALIYNDISGGERGILRSVSLIEANQLVTFQDLPQCTTFVYQFY